MSRNPVLKGKFFLFVVFLKLSSKILIASAQDFDGMQMPVTGMLVEYTGFPTEPLRNWTYSVVWGGRYTGNASERGQGTGRHAGIDIPLPPGEPIYAVANGTVTDIQRTGVQGGSAVKVVIRHSIPGVGTVYSVYFELRNYSIMARLTSNIKTPITD